MLEALRARGVYLYTYVDRDGFAPPGARRDHEGGARVVHSSGAPATRGEATPLATAVRAQALHGDVRAHVVHHHHGHHGHHGGGGGGAERDGDGGGGGGAAAAAGAGLKLLGGDGVEAARASAAARRIARRLQRDEPCKVMYVMAAAVPSPAEGGGGREAERFEAALRALEDAGDHFYDAAGRPLLEEVVCSDGAARRG